MRGRTVLLLALSAVLGLASPASAKVAAAKLVDCDAADRTADFTAVMRAIPGAERLQLRFTLQVRDDDGWERLEAPTFGMWSTAAPGRTRWVYDKHLENLQPGAYRVSIRLPWRDAA